MLAPTLPHSMARVTYREWCEARGWRYTTALRWRAQFEDFPDAVEQIGATYRYLESALDGWKKRHPELGVGRFGRPTPPDSDAE